MNNNQIAMDRDDFVIRNCDSADAIHIVQLWIDCGLTRPWNDPVDDINFALQSSTSDILLLIKENQIVGSVMFGHDGHRGWMYYLAVIPKYQGYGFGKLLVEAAEARLKSSGVAKINLMIRQDNKAVIDFYVGLEYIEEDVVICGKRLR